MSDPFGPGARRLGDDRPQVDLGGQPSVSPGGPSPGTRDYLERHPERPDVEGRSVGELISEVTGDLSKLMRQELELAKVELKAEAAKAGRGAGLLAGAGVAGNLMLVFLSLTVMWALGEVMHLAWAALIVTVVWAIVAAVLAARGRRELRNVNPKPERTVQTLKEDAQWAKTQSS